MAKKIKNSKIPDYEIPKSNKPAPISPEQLKAMQQAKKAKLAKEVKEKLEKLKKDAEPFKKQALKKFKKDILGIVLLPPKPKKKEEEKEFNILVLTQAKGDIKDKLKRKLEVSKELKKLASKKLKDVDISVVLLDELWDMCMKSKYEILNLIAMGMPIYDGGWIGAIRLVEIHKMMVLKKFEKYVISYVLAGSMVRGDATKDSDIDTFIVIDDTDVTRMTANELRSKLRSIIWGMGAEAGNAAGVKNKLNTQIYILSEMWDSIKSANPVIFTFLRDGIPLYDRGLFTPWKQLLKKGKITPTPEAVEKYIKSGKQVLDRTKNKLKEIGVEDFFWSTFTPSQGALMMIGHPPPHPKATPAQIREYFVKPGLLEEKYAKILDDILKIRKEIETGKRKEVPAKLVDTLMKKAESYLKRMDKLTKQLERKKTKKEIKELWEKTIEDITAALKMVGVKATPSKAIKQFETNIIKKKLSPSKFLHILKRIEKIHKKDEGSLKEIASLAFEEDRLAKDTFDLIRAEKGKRMEKYKISATYGKKRADIWLLSDKAFVIMDTSDPNTDIKEYKLGKNGALTKAKSVTLKTVNKEIKKFAGKPTTLTTKTIDSLKKILSKDMKIVIGA
ncbi:hypothetical protein GF374_00420 [Candidatus Woesearchaeota archaeon]|nr:hypothetical protein [Candidatus Woesearchaeota archaeon]